MSSLYTSMKEQGQDQRNITPIDEMNDDLQRDIAHIVAVTVDEAFT